MKSENTLQKPRELQTKQKIDRGRSQKEIRENSLAGWLPVAGPSWLD